MEEEKIIVDNFDEAENTIDVLDIESNSTIDETIHIIEVEATEVFTVESDEAFRALGEPNEQLKHQLLNGRDAADQHPITSITGLREELNDIEALDVVYSDERNQANYYLWEDKNVLQENRVGYFVSACSDINEIKICTSNNYIFGVTVDSAGFIGAQADVVRDIKYGLVVTTGIVHVRCESSVRIGDCVVSNNYGCAQKNNSGYKVVGRHQIDGVEYAEITLVTPIDKICELTDNVDTLNEKMDNAEANIAAAMNVANEAYHKASEAGNVSEEAIKNALDALDKSTNVETRTDDLESRLEDTNEVAVQGKSLAESALNYAETIHNEVKNKANEYLEETSKLRNEFEKKVEEIDSDLENASLELQATNESIENAKNDLKANIDDAIKDIESIEEELTPLAQWPDAENPSRTVGFVARANEDSATLAGIVTWKGDAGDSLAGFVAEATEENATVKSIASYERKDKDGNVIGSGASGLVAQVDANKADISLLAEFDGNIAGLQAQVDENTSAITTLASHVIGDYVAIETWDPTATLNQDTVYYAIDTKTYWYYKNGWKSTDKMYDAGLGGAVAGVQQIADDNKAQLDAVASYEKDGKTGLAGLSAYVDEHEANIDTLARYDNEQSGNSGIAGLIADVNDNTSALSVVAKHSFTDDDGKTYTGLAGLQAQVNDNTSEVSLVAKRITCKYIIVPKYDQDKIEDLDTNKIYYTEWSYVENGVTKYVVHIWIYENSEWKYVQGFHNFVSTYPNVLQQDTVYYFGDNLQYYAYWNKNSWATTKDSYEAGLPSSIAGIQVEVDENSSQINQLVSWQGTTNDSMARIEQKADDNGASINLMVSSVDKYSVGEYSQSYGLTYEQAKSVLKEGTIYIPVNHPNGKTHIEGDDVEVKIPNSDGMQFVFYSGDGEYSIESKYYNNNSGLWSYSFEDGSDLRNTTIDTNIIIVHDNEPYYIPKPKNEFTEGNYYEWGVYQDVFGNDVYDWIEYSSSVALFKDVPAASNKLKYWYINSDEAPEGYEVHTLYIWEDNEWKKVNVLAGNVNNRITSMIRQTADKIALDVANAQDGVASHQQWLDENSANIQDVVSWKYDVENDVSNIATIKQTADEAGASVALVVTEKNGEKVVDAASIVTAINDGDSSVVIAANRVDISGIDVNLKGKTINLTADDIGITSDNFNVSTEGNLWCRNAEIIGTITSNDGKIGGWVIKPGAIFTEGSNYNTNGILIHTTYGIIGRTYDKDANGNLISITHDDGSISYQYTDNFTLDLNGSLFCQSGKIGGWNIGSDWLYSDGFHNNNGITLGLSPTAGIIYKNGSTELFKVNGGTVYVKGEIHATDGTFRGKLDAATGSFSGTLNAGTILSNNVLIRNGTHGPIIGTSDGKMGIYFNYTSSSNNTIQIEGVNIYLGSTNGQGNLTVSSSGGNLSGTWTLNTSSNVTSDINKKHEIEILPSQYLDLLDNLNPIRYKYNDGTSDRYHTGFIAQEVSDALTTANIDSKDFAGLVILNQGEEDETWTLRYEEFIALNTAAIQKLKARVTELESIVEKLQQKEE